MFKVDRSETPPYINDMFNQRIFDENVPLLRSAIFSNFIPVTQAKNGNIQAKFDIFRAYCME